MAELVKSNENEIPLWNYKVSQQVFVQSLQTQNASHSYDSPNFKDGFLYFPELNNKRRTGATDAQNAGEMRHLFHVRLEEHIHRPPPIGLKLRKTNSLAKLIVMALNDSERTKKSPPIPEKFTAVQFPVSVLRIGAFNIVATHEADLVGKCYYAKRKLVWEILDKGLKHKIEVLWQNILAMRAVIKENRPGILEIELDKEPTFYHETDPRPRKHTIWQLSEDFTGGQALTHRRHYLEFPPGVFDKHYGKLIQCDNRLLQLSQRPFPSLNSPYFDSYLSYQGATDYSYGYDLRGSKTNPATHQQTPLVVSTQQAEQFVNTIPPSLVYSTSPTSVVDIRSPHFKVINNRRHSKLALTSQGYDDYANILVTDPMPCASDVELHTSRPYNENFSDVANNIWLTNCDSERHTAMVKSSSTFAGLSMEVDPVYNNTYASTRIDHLPNTQALTYGSHEHYCASNANMEHMHGDLSDEVILVPNPQALHYIPSLQITNENLETHLPDTLHPHVTTKWSTSGDDNHDYHG